MKLFYCGNILFVNKTYSAKHIHETVNIFRTYKPQKNQYPARGYILNKNTLESFKTCDKIALLKQFGASLQESITSGAALETPHLLVSFIILTFGVRKNLFFYHF